MKKPTIDVERVVREVLAEMGIAPANSGEDGGRKAEKSRDCGTGSSDLILTARVVTMAEVAGRLKAVRRLVVRQEAVVTPAVRDELLCRGRGRLRRGGRGRADFRGRGRGRLGLRQDGRSLARCNEPGKADASDKEAKAGHHC